MSPKKRAANNRAERREINSTEARAERGRRNIEKRWAKYREDRIAAGLPATKTQARGRRERFVDPDSEPYWLAEVERLGLVSDDDTRTARRLAAKHLADSVTADLGRYSPDDGPLPTPVGDDDVLVAFWGQEAARYRRRAERDIQMAQRHHALADDAERELAAIVLRRSDLR
jgi:hypothetical protein